MATNLIKRHWKGELGLTPALLIILLLSGIVLIALNYLLNLLINRYTTLEVPLTLGWLVLLTFVVIPWLLIGLLRTAEADRQKTGYSTRLYATQAVVLLCLVATVNHAIVSLQLLVASRADQAHSQASKIETYTLTQTADTLHIEGLLDFGITEAVETQLGSHTDITRVTLNSEGGQLYEGRGLARLIESRQLNTCVIEQCNSACIVAFLAGEQRALDHNSTMGFHQYRFDENRKRQNIGLFDIAVEEKKDREFYHARGIDAQFIRRVFETPSSTLWKPTREELKDAGVINTAVCG